MSARRRILLLLPFTPTPDATHGGARVTTQLTVALAEHHDVAVVYLRGRDEPAIHPDVRAHLAEAREVAREGGRISQMAHGVRARIGPWLGTPSWVSRWTVGEFGDRARELARGWRPEIVQAEYHLMGQYLRAAADGVPTVLTDYDPGVRAARERAARARTLLARATMGAEVRAWERYARRALSQADAIVVLTERDRAATVPYAGTSRVSCVPFGAEVTEAMDPSAADRSVVLFVGNFGHVPNREAARRLVQSIFPRVRERRPDAVLEIVGGNAPDWLHEGASGHVRVAGHVHDLAACMRRAAVVVAPLSSGGGMRVKVTEALAAGKAVVATTLAVEGLPLAPGRHAEIADDDASFADAIVALLGDENRRAALGAAAHAWADEFLGWERTVAGYERVYDELLSSRGGLE